MKRLERVLLGGMLAVFAVILVLLPVHAFISTWGGTVIGPLEVWKSWKEIALALLAPTVFIYLCLRPDIAKLLWARWINRYIVLYTVLVGLFAITSAAASQAAIAGLLMDLRFLAMFALAQVIVAGSQHLEPLLKRWLAPWLLWTTIAISVFAILQITVLPKDFLAHFGYNKNATIAPYVLVDQNPNALRAFSTLRGPNELGSYLLLPLAVSLWLVVHDRRNVLAGTALGMGLAALALSGSRSAWLGAAIGLVVWVALSVSRTKALRLAKWSVVPVLVAGTIIAALAASVPDVRLAVFHSRADRVTLTEGSTANHWKATLAGIQDAAAHPLGQGVGVAGPASFYNTSAPPKIAEDYFVQIAQELGPLGLLLFIIINVLVARGLWQQRAGGLWPKVLLASFAGLTCINLFLHGWADDPTSMTWWGLAGLFAAAGKGFKK